jgi:cytochrome oxidase Cu insertion factor (SCO1/SenC/PrrC family)
MNKTRLAAIIVVIIVTLGGLAAMQFWPSGQSQMRSSGKALVGGPFSLTGHNGAKVTDEQFRGKYMLVFFGYTFCPDVCPAGLQVMTAALDRLGSAADGIQPMFITIDPERDTVPILAEYMAHFHSRLIGLTGTPKEITEVAKAYRVYYAKSGDKSSNEYLMDHSSIIYLMGPGGDFVKHFAYGTDADALAQGIRKAIDAN